MQSDWKKGLSEVFGALSEEAKVCIAVLIIQGYAIYAEVANVELTILLFSVIGGYLTLRLLKCFGLLKD